MFIKGVFIKGVFIESVFIESVFIESVFIKSSPRNFRGLLFGLFRASGGALPLFDGIRSLFFSNSREARRWLRRASLL